MLPSFSRSLKILLLLIVGIFSITGIIARADSVSVDAGKQVTLVATADGTAPFSYQWYKDGVLLNGATTSTFVINNFQSASAGTYTAVIANSAGSATSGGATLSVASGSVVTSAPVFTTQPASQTVVAGGFVTFTAVATGSPAPSYQWKKSGVIISGATNATYTILNLVTGNAGSYSVVATNSAGSATSATATLTVNALSSAPVFTTQPVNQTAPVGSSVTFTAVAAGSPAPTFQWRKNGVRINGATNASYTVTNIATGSAGTYTVAATNSIGSVTSVGAVLTVTATAAAPVITSQPAGQSAVSGAVVTLTVAASGSPTPTFQWKKNGANIAGATGASYTIIGFAAANAGSYTVAASNIAGTVTSTAATLALDGTTIPAGFDVQGYFTRYPDAKAYFGNDTLGAWLYYRDYGIYQGEVYDDLFRVEEYLALYPELFAVYGTDLSGALMHWLTVGQLEGRIGRIPVGFSSSGYFARNADVAAAVNFDPILAWDHFWQYGIYEGRSYDDELRVFEYIAINPDLQTAFLNDWRGALMHWLRYGRTEGRLGRIPLIFNSANYLSRYPDVAVSWGSNPTTVWQHFWIYGIEEGRVFDEVFRVNEYLAMYPDLAAKFGTDRRAAFMHWVRYGQTEGRLGRLP